MARAHRKDSLRIEAIGAVDELNSAIGLLLAEPQARTFGR
jgi:cob(I)alamin adenosyltransferase